jgi:hypothetical protein
MVGAGGSFLLGPVLIRILSKYFESSFMGHDYGDMKQKSQP